MRLIIARHGNTFGADDVVRRVGSRTDIPLVEKGREQARDLGVYLATRHPISKILCGELKRLRETAEIISKQSAKFTAPTVDARFNELDYGTYDGMEERQFVSLIGEDALKKWDAEAIPPAEWNIDTNRLKTAWSQFGEELVSGKFGECVLVVTSNGTARFAPHLTGKFAEFCSQYGLKLATGAFGEFEYIDHKWHVIAWNKKP